MPSVVWQREAAPGMALPDHQEGHIVDALQGATRNNKGSQCLAGQRAYATATGAQGDEELFDFPLHLLGLSG